MKRAKNLYNQLLNREKIKEIIIKASKGKRKRGEVRAVLADIDNYADKVLEMLRNKTYYLYPTHHKKIMENGKERNLTISPFFPNRILDYCFVEVLKPIIKKGMYEYCIGNVDGRGATYGQRYIEKNIRKYKYFLKLDIHKFYPSVQPSKLVECLKMHIKDEDFLKFASFIVLANKDLPIGSYYSQWCSNLYLQKLDHYIKEVLRVPLYVRYVDDMLLCGNNKRKLKCAMYEIQRHLHALGLTLKREEYVKEVDETPIDFLGFRFYECKTYLRQKIFKALNRRLKSVRKKRHCSARQAQSIMSYLGWFKQLAVGYGYYKNKVRKTISFGALRRIISNAS